MPRLGVPSTTDSTPRPHSDVCGEPAPYRGRQIPGLTVDLAALSRGFFNPLLNRPEKGRKEGAWGRRARRNAPFSGRRRAHSLRQGRNDPENSCWPVGERSTPRKVIDPSKSYDDAQNQGQFLQHRLHSGKAWHVKEAKEAYVGLCSTALISARRA